MNGEYPNPLSPEASPFAIYVEPDIVTLSTGRKIRISDAFIRGLGPYAHPADNLTSTERAEIADAMIRRWQAWASARA